MNKQAINELLASKSLRAIDQWIRQEQYNLKLFMNCNAESYTLITNDNIWFIELDLASYGNRITVTNRPLDKTCTSKQKISNIGKRALQQHIIEV